MRSNLRWIAFLLTSTAAFAQHGGGFRGGVAGGSRSGRPASSSSAGRVFLGTSRPFVSPLIPPGFPFPYAPSGFAFPERPLISPIGGNATLLHRSQFGRQFGSDFFPYFPFFGDYAEAYPPPNGAFMWQSPYETASPSIPMKPGHPVIHDYPENDKTAASGSSPATFTIALKDGSTRSAETVWIQDNALHCLDSQGNEDVLSSDRIDRDATHRLNREKNLHLELPPA